MSEEKVVRKNLKELKGNIVNIPDVTDEEIHQQIADDPDVAPICDIEWFKTAKKSNPK